jgi:hypothetical protein
MSKYDSGPCWRDKIPRLVWRGRPNDGQYDCDNWFQKPRGKVVHWSLQNPSGIIDAGFTGFYEWFAPNVDFFQGLCNASFMTEVEQAAYKYQIDIDGTTATFTGLAWKLLSGSLVFKQTSNNIMWFHHLLEPWKHYVPVKTDLSDLYEMLDWAKKNDSEAEAIASAGREFALQYLSPESIRHYAREVIIRYADFVAP